MQTIKKYKKQIITYSILFLTVFILGMVTRPAYDNTKTWIKSKTTPAPVTYQREDSEYEKMRKEIYNDPRVQEAFDSFVVAYIEKQNADRADKAKMEAQDKYSAMSLEATQEMAKAKGHADAIMSDLLATVPQVNVK